MRAVPIQYFGGSLDEGWQVPEVRTFVYPAEWAFRLDIEAHFVAIVVNILGGENHLGTKGIEIGFLHHL